jgi:hypothetical protein
MTEAQNYRTAFNTYYGLYDKVPGVSEVDGSANKVNSSKEAWDDLYKEGITDKKPDNEGFVIAKYRGAYWMIENITGSFAPSSCITDFDGLNTLILAGKNSDDNKRIGVLGMRETQSLLDKLDDGSHETGLVRAVYNFENKACKQLADDQLYGLVMKLDF